MMPDKRAGVKARALFFHSPIEAEFKKIKIKDGTIVIDNKEWDVGKIRSINLKSGTGVRPLYLLKWNSLIPAQLEERTDEISYKPTGDVENDGKSYLKFWKRLKKSGHTGKEIETNNWVYKRIASVPLTFLKTKFSPELLHATADMRFLKNMKTYAQGKGGGGGGINIIYLLGAFVIGLVWAIILLYLTGVIKTL
jgi:hypothetical protein